MAKIFRTETLSLNADNIRLSSSANDTFQFTDENGTVVMSNATINSDVSSLKAVDVTQDSDISSLQAVDVTHDSDISSLKAIDVTQDSDISSLKAIDVTQDSDISSLAADITTNDVQVKSTELASGDTSKTVTFTSEFPSTPSVVGTLISTTAADPIVGLQMSAISTTAVTFQFSDEIPSEDYSLEILASV